MTAKEVGRVPNGTGLSSSTESFGLGPSGFDPSRAPLPCPFCGGLWLTIEAACYGHCKSCGADGPVFDNWSEDSDYRVEVTTLWNERQPFVLPPAPRLGGNITPSEWLRSGANRDRKIRANCRADEAGAIADWIDQIARDSDRSGEAGTTPKSGVTEGESAGPKDIAQNVSGEDQS